MAALAKHPALNCEEICCDVNYFNPYMDYFFFLEGSVFNALYIGNKAQSVKLQKTILRIRLVNIIEGS